MRDMMPCRCLWTLHQQDEEEAWKCVEKAMSAWLERCMRIRLFTAGQESSNAAEFPRERP